MRTAVLGALAVSSLLVATSARAQNLGETPVAAPASTFGNPGQVVISQDFAVKFEYESENETSAVILAPAIDYFLIPNLSLGGQLIFSYAKNGGVSFTNIGVGPRDGFNFSLAPMFSFYPKAGFSIIHSTGSSESGGVTVSRSETFIGVGLFTPFLFHPVPHFFIGFGPSFSGNISGGTANDRFLTFTLETVIGGYFDW